MKILRINDDLHSKIKYLAEKERRTINVMAEMLLEQVVDGTPVENTPLPKNTNVQKVEDVRMNVGGTPPSADVEGLIKRDKGDILAKIRETEAERDEELRYCQDIEVANGITEKYAKVINDLWDEYKEIE